MAFGLGDFLKQTTTTAGTGTVDLIAASAPYRDLTNAAGATVLYVIRDSVDFESGVGTVTAGSPDTLSRDTVLESSNGGAKVNWSGNTKDVYIEVPAKFIQTLLDHTAGTGVICRTVAAATGLTYVARTLAASAPLSMADGDGVAGAPTVSLTIGEGLENDGGALALDIDGLTEDTAPLVTDAFGFWDSIGSLKRKITLANLFKVINGFTEEAGIDTSADFVPFYDVTAGAVRKIKPDDLAPKKIVQVQKTEDGAVATGTTQTVFDDSIPQNTEGDQYMSVAITPTDAANLLRIDVVWIGSASVAACMIAALFQDSTADALAAAPFNYGVSAEMMTIAFTHYMTAGTTSATTFKVRAGCNTAATTTFNGVSGGRKLGGVLASSITVTEIVP